MASSLACFVSFCPVIISSFPWFLSFLSSTCFKKYLIHCGRYFMTISFPHGNHIIFPLGCFIPPWHLLHKIIHWLTVDISPGPHSVKQNKWKERQNLKRIRAGGWGRKKSSCVYCKHAVRSMKKEERWGVACRCEVTSAHVITSRERRIPSALDRPCSNLFEHSIYPSAPVWWTTSCCSLKWMTGYCHGCRYFGIQTPMAANTGKEHTSLKGQRTGRGKPWSSQGKQTLSQW